MDEHQARRQQLEAQLAQLERRQHKVESDRRRETNALEQDWQEQASTRQNDEVLDSLEAEGGQQIAIIRAALKRLDEGTYGICMTCGKAIAQARLDALPHAVQCIQCAEKTDREGHHRR
jgi:RNA polymerase-binding transcription factor DksA